MTKVGYEFKGWYKTTGSNKIKVTSIANSVGDLELTAEFKAILYTIEYELDGGNNNDNPSIFTIESEDIVLNNPTKEGLLFVGWYDAELGGNKVEVIRKGTNKNIKLYARFQEEFSLTFKDGNQVLSTESIKYGTTITKPDNPTKEGYRFVGWDKTIPANMPKEDLEFTAIWELEEYTISCNLDGGEVVETIPTTYTIESDDIILATPTKEGYSFKGYYDTKDLTTKVEKISKGSTGNVSLKALWVPRLYSISYVLNGGINADEVKTNYSIEECVELALPTKESYDFSGWYVNENLSGDSIKTIVLGSTGDKVYYAKWVEHEYEITYELNGGTNNLNNPSSFNIDSKYTLQEPTKEGNTFEGFYLNADFSGEKITVINKEYTKDLCLYAKWRPYTYTIVYNANGGKGTKMANTIANYGEDVSLTTSSFTKLGYDFIGWSTDKNAKVADYSDEEYVNSLSNKNKGQVILYAIYEPLEYELNVNYNGGEIIKGDDVPTSYNIDTKIVLPTLTKTGYKFNGWYSYVKKADGTTNTKPTKYTSISKYYTNMDIYADFTVINYSIAYQLNGGKLSIKSSEYDTTYNVEKLSNFDLPTNEEISKTGYNFEGWYLDKAYTISAEELTNDYGMNITLYAKWSPITYTIEYLKNDDDALGYMDNQELTYDKASNLTTNSFVKPGYVFNGWYYINPTNSKKVSLKDKASVKNLLNNEGTITLYATYKKVDSYTIKCNLNGGVLAKGNTIPSKYTYIADNEEVIELYAPTRTGYIFNGWCSDSECNNLIGGTYTEGINQEIPLSSYENYTLYAKWTPITYYISFEANNRNVDDPYAMDEEVLEVSYDEQVTLPDNLYTRVGIKFSKWTTVINGKTTTYANKAKVKNLSTIDGQTIVLSATWSYSNKQIYKITYNLNGGKNNASNPTTYNIDTPYFELKEPTKLGYNFEGWYLDKNYEEEIAYIDSKQEAKAYSLYAKWSPITYNINFESEDDSTSNTDYLYDTSYKLDNDIFKQDGKYVAKWSYTYTDTKGKEVTKVISGNASIKNLCTSQDEEITLSVNQWAYYKYTIKYVLNSGKNNTKINKSSYTSQTTIEFADPTRSDADFLGWYLDPDFTEEISSTDGYYQNLTLYACWDTGRYDITYDNSDADIEANNPNCYLKGASFTLQSPTKYGYSFTGWFDENNKQVKSITTKTTGDLNLTARWKENSYTISYNTNGGKLTKGSTSKQSKILYSDLSLLEGEGFYLDGYTLIGWSTNKKATTPDYDLGECQPYLTKTSITLYAVWEKD